MPGVLFVPLEGEFGWSRAAISLAIAFGAGAARTRLGDSQVAFMFSGLLCLLAAGMAIRIGRVSRALVPAAG